VSPRKPIVVADCSSCKWRPLVKTKNLDIFRPQNFRLCAQMCFVLLSDSIVGMKTRWSSNYLGSWDGT
jgi:hypothetical protein